MKKKRRAIVDADSLIYSSCCVEERENPFKEGDYVTNMSNLKMMFDNKIKFLMARIKCDSYTLYIGGRNNFRREMFPTYKASRKDTRLPEGLNLLQDHVVENHGAVRSHGAEADDYCVMDKLKNPNDLLVAIDKDVLNSCPGKHYNFWKEEYVEVEEDYARWFLYYQAIIGDGADNIKGVPGIGPKKAINFIGEWEECRSVDELWLGVLEAYSSKGLGLEDALYNIRQVCMTQYDYEKNELNLWEPPTIGVDLN